MKGRVLWRSTSERRGGDREERLGYPPSPSFAQDAGENGGDADERGVLRDENISGSENRRKREVNWGCNRVNS